MRSYSLAVCLAAGAILLVAAVDPHTAIPARQAGMKQIGRTFKGINDQLHAAAPNAAELKAGTAQLADLAARLPSWFPAGTGPETGVKTAAKADVWAHPADFHAKAAALAGATRALASAAATSGNPAVLTPLVAHVGGACKGCHESYRVPEH